MRHIRLRLKPHKNPQNVNNRLSSLSPKALANAKNEAADLQKMIENEGNKFKLASWDWDFYAEKVRAKRYNFDASQLKPYFEMDNVLQKGVFYSATKLFGITFNERFDLPVYHEDVRVFEVFNEEGNVLGLFLFDGYARSTKRGGAWMNAYVSQSRLKNNLPIVANHQNVVKPPNGEPALMSFDEVITMFHDVWTCITWNVLKCKLSIFFQVHRFQEILSNTHLKLMKCGLYGHRYYKTMLFITKLENRCQKSYLKKFYLLKSLIKGFQRQNI